jgi:two-component system sensor histidine kinase YesM
MIRKQLVISYILLLTLFLALVILTSFNSLSEIFYHENAIRYENELSADQDKLQSLILDAENDSLIVCTDESLQELLNGSSLPAASQFRAALAGPSRVESGRQISVLPVCGEDIYRLSADGSEWLKSSDPLEAYPLDYRYHWIFRPGGQDVIRVQRIMYDNSDITRVLAIVSVDVSIPSFSDIFYVFGAGSDLKGALYLTDSENQCLLPINHSGTIEPSEHVFPDLTDAAYDLHDQQITIVKTLSNGWQLIAVIDGSSLLTGVYRVLKTILLVGLIIELAGIASIYLLTRQITDPLLKLSRQIKQAAEKEEYQPLVVPDNAKGEVRVLYDSYNDLIQEVQRSIEKIHEVSQRENENQFLLLQAQINPHFLYNTLNAISFMAQNGQTEDIQKVVQALVTMFRTSLNNGKPEVTVRQEIGHVASYLEIMQYRYPDNYTVRYEIAPETEDLKILKQILQPLAENALIHGILETGTKGEITIRSFLEADHLVLSLANTGSAIDLSLVHRLLEGDEELAGKHYGIRNVNWRLVNLYGPEAGLQYRVVNGQTIAETHIPLSKIRRENIDESIK